MFDSIEKRVHTIVYLESSARSNTQLESIHSRGGTLTGRNTHGVEHTRGGTLTAWNTHGVEHSITNRIFIFPVSYNNIYLNK